MPIYLWAPAQDVPDDPKNCSPFFGSKILAKIYIAIYTFHVFQGEETNVRFAKVYTVA